MNVSRTKILMIERKKPLFPIQNYIALLYHVLFVRFGTINSPMQLPCPQKDHDSLTMNFQDWVLKNSKSSEQCARYNNRSLTVRFGPVSSMLETKARRMN